jgi:hypothetical protein
MRWADFEAEQPELAELGKKKLGVFGLVLIGSIRLDGTARLSPVNPHFWEDDLYFSLAASSRKAGDLLRDDRLLVHNVPGHRDGRDGEYKVRGRAILEPDPGTQSRFANMIKELYGWGPEPGTFRLFRMDVEDVTFIDREKSTDQLHPDITRWPG